MEKTKLKSLYDKGELIKYKDTYYEISNILLDSKKISIYELSSINKNKKDSKTITVESTDKNITGIYKKDQEKILSYLKFVDRYNSTISFLNKKKITRICILILKIYMKIWIISLQDVN